MPRRRWQFRASYVLVACLLACALLLTSGITFAANRPIDGLIAGTSYESPQFHYTITWEEPWSTRQQNVTSNRGGRDTITIRDGNRYLKFSGQADDVERSTALDDAIELILKGTKDTELVTRSDAIDQLPTAELVSGRNTILIEIHTLPERDAVVVVTLTTRTTDLEAARKEVPQTVLLDDLPVFTGNPSAPSANTDPVLN